MKSTVLKPSNGKAKNKPKNPQKNRPPSFSLRRLTKRQRAKLARIGVIVFLIIFTVTIIGGLVAISVKPAGN